MPESFAITYEVERFDCYIPTDGTNASFEGFVEHSMTGRITIQDGKGVTQIDPCGLLRISRSLIRLITFPVMYGRDAFETVLDSDINFHSTFTDGHIILSVSSSWPKEQTVFRIPLDRALQVVGHFHQELLYKLNKECPELRRYGTFLVCIPDAFALVNAFNIK